MTGKSTRHHGYHNEPRQEPGPRAHAERAGRIKFGSAFGFVAGSVYLPWRDGVDRVGAVASGHGVERVI